MKRLMIKVQIFRNLNNEIYRFVVFDHGDSIVCSAVSILVLNTVNSIENFTGERFDCNYDENGGFIECRFPDIENGAHNHDVNLLLNAMLLGLRGIDLEYENNILINDDDYKEV